MNVFILSTGRCGSMSFAKACDYIENYSSGHETRVNIIGPHRLDYDDSHIESDNRLSWFLGRLDEKYGNDAFYVHLLRNTDAVAKSYAKRANLRGLIINAYKKGIYLEGEAGSDYDVALDYVHTVNGNIKMFLKGKTKKMVFDLDGDLTGQFGFFWERINASGDLDAALAELKKTHNTSKKITFKDKIANRIKNF